MQVGLPRGKAARGLGNRVRHPVGPVREAVAVDGGRHRHARVAVHVRRPPVAHVAELGGLKRAVAVDVAVETPEIRGLVEDVRPRRGRHDRHRTRQKGSLFHRLSCSFFTVRRRPAHRLQLDKIVLGNNIPWPRQVTSEAIGLFKSSFRRRNSYSLPKNIMSPNLLVQANYRIFLIRRQYFRAHFYKKGEKCARIKGLQLGTLLHETQKVCPRIGRQFGHTFCSTPTALGAASRRFIRLPGRVALRRGRMESRHLGGGLTGKAAILAALQPPALHHRISQSPVVGTAFHRRPVGRGVPPSRQAGSRVPRDRVCRRQSVPCAQTIPRTELSPA